MLIFLSKPNLECIHFKELRYNILFTRMKIRYLFILSISIKIKLLVLLLGIWVTSSINSSQKTKIHNYIFYAYCKFYFINRLYFTYKC